MATPISRAQAASTEGEAIIKSDPSGWQKFWLGNDGKFDILPGDKGDYTPGGAANAAGDAFIAGIKTIFTSDFMKRLAAAIVGMALIIIVLAKFAGEQAGVV